MPRTRPTSYGWPDAERALAKGVHPAVVAARMGTTREVVLETADEHGWPVRWQEPTPDEIVAAVAREIGRGG